jgi:hypothetical protein
LDEYLGRWPFCCGCHPLVPSFVYPIDEETQEDNLLVSCHSIRSVEGSQTNLFKFLRLLTSSIMFECVRIAQSWPLLCPLSCLRSDWKLCADILARQPMRFRSCTGMSEIGSRSWPSSLSCRSRSQTRLLLVVAVVDVVFQRLVPARHLRCAL